LDLIGTGAFVIVAAVTRKNHPLSAACVALWAFRLAAFLFYRVQFTHHDARLDDLLSTNVGAFGFWYISAVWGILCSLPHTLAVLKPSKKSSSSVIAFGLLVFLIGFAIETMSDLQKWEFKAENPSSFCNAGLWQYSQHPNYAGNLLLWFGILIMNSSRLRDELFPVALVSPMFMLFLFYGQAMGFVTDSAGMIMQK
jgi:steroid 5-alpha reductase family enzyme